MASGGRVRVEAMDAVAFLRGLPADSVDLVFTSPPYLEARTYGIGAGRKLDVWVPWMVEVVTECVRVCKGLVAVVCEGQTRGYKYLPAPFLLMAELHRAGFNLRKPVVYQRYGIPGSGGPDYLRNDWEPVVVVSRPGKLKWSNNVAVGNKPIWSTGGPMTNRKTNGVRVSRASVPGSRRRTGSGVMEDQVGKIFTRLNNGYVLPEKANPGNVIRCNAGGNMMGHDLAHENEAPFPLKLAAFFVQSFCPPGTGVVCDPFMGSGTTAHAAYEHGRDFIGCDIRQSQVDLTLRRLATVTPTMFTAAG